MATEIRQSQLRNDNAVIMRRVTAGESFVVTVNGRRLADVVPHQRDTGRRQFVPTAEAVAALTQTPISKQESQHWWQTYEKTRTSQNIHGSVRLVADEHRVSTGAFRHLGADRPPSAQQICEHADALAVSVIAIGELQYGITAAVDPVEQTHRRQRVQNILDQFDVLPFDVPTAEYYGALATLVSDHGRKPRSRRMDLQIAATAVRDRLVLLRRNIDDFAGLESALNVVGLPDQP